MKTRLSSHFQRDLRLTAVGATACAFSSATVPTSRWTSQFWSWSWPRGPIWDLVSSWNKRWR